MKRQLGWMTTLVVVAALWNGPAIAEAVADYARDSDRVDGFHAVGAGASDDQRAKKLVATNKNGRLPNGIVARVAEADNAGTIDYFDSSRLLKSCDRGSLAGYALVPADVPGDMSPVPGTGFTKLIGGPPPPPNQPGESCDVSEPTARRLSTGVYEVSLYSFQFATCLLMDEELFAAVVSVRDDRPLVTTYEAECRDDGLIFTVRIHDLQGSPTDAAFTLATLSSPTIPLP